MKPAIPRLEVSREELLNLLEHARTEALSEPEYQQLKAALDTLVYLTQLVEDKNTTIGRLRQILFGASSEKMSQVLETLAANRASSGEPDGGGKSEEEKTSPQPPESAPSPGHGRNGADAYSGARHVKIEHSSLKSGNHCPGCQKGKLYAWATPGVLIRVVGQAPLAATVYELEKLRAILSSGAGGNMLQREPRRSIWRTMVLGARDLRQRGLEWKFKPGEFYQTDRLPDQLFGSGHSLNINEAPESGEQSSWSFQDTCSNPSERMRSSSCTGASTGTR